MSNTRFSTNSLQSASISEPTYIEVSGFMDDFMSLEEIAPGAELSDVLAATWGVPSTSDTVKMRALQIYGMKAQGIGTSQNLR
jgi:hypothetical protein